MEPKVKKPLMFDYSTVNTVQILDALYARAMPGVKLVGFSAPAACEVVTKAPLNMQLEGEGMEVVFNSQTQTTTPSGLTKSVLKGAKAFATTEATVSVIKPSEVSNLATDSFYSAAKLGAFISAAGGDHNQVNHLLTKIYGDSAPRIDQYMPNLKESWNVRSVVPTSKSNHQIFGETNTVYNVAISTEKYQKKDKDEAVDWGRVYLSLKFVGSVNVKFDPNATKVLRSLFFVMPKHNWPIMSKESFLFPEKLKAIKLQPVNNKYLAPLADESELEAQLLEKYDEAKRFVLKNTNIPNEFLEAAKEMVMKRIWNRSRTTTTISHVPREATAVIMDPLSPFQIQERFTDNFMREYRYFMSKEMARHFLHDDEFRLALVKTLKARRSGFREGTVGDLELMTKMVFTPAVLIRAAKHLTRMGFQSVEQQLLSRWGSIAGSTLQLTEKFYFSQIAKKSVSNPRMLTDHLLAFWDALQHAAYSFTVSTAIGTPLDNVIGLVTSVKENFERIKRYWYLSYKSRAEVELKKKDKILYQQLSKSFKVMTLDTLLMFPDVWFDPENDAKHILLDAANKYHRKRHMKVDLSHINPTQTMITVGYDIESAVSSQALLPWGQLGSTLTAKFSQLRNDLLRILDMHKIVPQDTDYDFDEGPFRVFKAAMVSKAVRFEGETKEEVAEKVLEAVTTQKVAVGEIPQPISLAIDTEAFNMDFDMDMGFNETSIEAMIATWPTEEMATVYANMKGFKSFQDMYESDPSSDSLLYNEEQQPMEMLLFNAQRQAEGLDPVYSTSVIEDQ